MYDCYELGPTPSDEDCIQVEPTGAYRPAMVAELHRYRDLLQQVMPVPDGIPARFTIKFFPHDFGTYGEVVITYDAEDPQAIEFAWWAEAHTPTTWDDTTPRVYTPELTEELLLQE